MRFPSKSRGRGLECFSINRNPCMAKLIKLNFGTDFPCVLVAQKLIPLQEFFGELFLLYALLVKFSLSCHFNFMDVSISRVGRA